MSAIRGVEHVLWICERPFSVVFLRDQHAKDNDNTEARGTCHGERMEIEISGHADVSRGLQRATLLHEVFHACCAVVHPEQHDEESHARALEVGLYSAIRDSRNVWFRTFLFEPDELLIPSTT